MNFGVQASERLDTKQLHRHVTPLSEVQKHFSSLWELSLALYDQLSVAFLELA